MNELKVQEHLIGCAYYGLKSACTHLLYSVRWNKCTKKDVATEIAMLLNPNTASKSDYLAVLIRTPVNFD